MRKIKVGDIVVAKKRVGEVRRLFTSKDIDLAFVYFPYEHRTDSMILSGYEQNQRMSDLRVATASEKKDFQRLKKELKSGGSGMGGTDRYRFELIDPAKNSRKFWEIEVNGAEVTTFWGRIGQAASQKTKNFGSQTRAETEYEKLVKEKEKKGYKAVGFAKPSSKKSGAKTSGSAKGGKECAHCGMASKGPTDCPEPWEHSHYKGGCVAVKKGLCAWCKANGWFTSSETNWLAKHGWSSAQIKAMSDSPKGRKEARALIKAGKPKKPGVETEAAALTGPQKKLLAEGVGFEIKKSSFTAICNGVAKLKGSADKTKSYRRALDWLVKGFFTDGKRDLVVLPRDESVLGDVHMALHRVPTAKSLGAAVYGFMLKMN